MQQLLVEAAIVGLIIVIIGSFVDTGISWIGLKKECEDWKLALFLTGASAHLLLESVRMITS